MDPHLDRGVAFPSRSNSCSVLLRSVSPRKAGARCAQHRGGHCNCGTAPLHLCNTAPQGCGKDKDQVCVCVCMCWAGAELSLSLAICFSRRLKGLGECHSAFICYHFCLMGHQAPSLSHYEERYFTNKLPLGTQDFIMCLIGP